MSIENEKLINLIDTKDLLAKWNIDEALNSLNNVCDKTVDFKCDLNRIWLEIICFQSWEKWEEFTSWVNDILSKFLVQNNDNSNSNIV